MSDLLVEDRPGNYGSFVDPAEFKATPKALPAQAVRFDLDETLFPSNHTLTNLPAIAEQGTPTRLGSPGSCEAQSFGYGLGSVTSCTNTDGTVLRDASLPQNEPSAAFLYKYGLMRKSSNKTCPHGTMAIPYLERLVVHGCPSAADVPYCPDCTYLDKIDLNKSYGDSSNFLIGSYYSFEIKNRDISLFFMKGLLLSGHAIAFSGPVLTDYDDPKALMSDGIIIGTETAPHSGHGQLVVGYDDTVGPAGDEGALLVQNSFGTNWPPADCNSIAPAGMIYWSYKTFFVTQSLAAIAFPLNPNAITGTSLTDANSSDAQGTAYVTQYAVGTTASYLIVQTQFTKPLFVNSITMTEPTTGSTMSGGFSAYIKNGYLYFRRYDGNVFLTGDWGITINATDTITKDQLSLASNSIPVPPAGASRTPTALTAGLEVTDTVGEAATIVIGG